MEKQKKAESAYADLSSFLEKETGDQSIFSFLTNLDENGNREDRNVFFGKKGVYTVSLGEKKIKAYPFDKIEEARYESFVGGAACSIRFCGEWVEVCRAFAAEKANLSQFVRLVNEVLDGVLRPEDAVFVPRITVCPKCRRPLRKGSNICPGCTEKKGMMKRLFSLMKGSFFWVFLSMLLFFIHSLLNVLLPVIQGKFVDDFLNTKDPALLLGDYTPAILIVGSMALVRILVVLATIFRNNILSKVSVKTVLEIRRRLYEKIQSLSVAGISRHTAGDLMNRVSSDTNIISNFLTSFLPTLLEQAFVILFVSGMLFSYSPKMAFMILCPAPFVAILFDLSGREHIDSIAVNGLKIPRQIRSFTMCFKEFGL